VYEDVERLQRRLDDRNIQRDEIALIRPQLISMAAAVLRCVSPHGAEAFGEISLRLHTVPAVPAGPVIGRAVGRFGEEEAWMRLEAAKKLLLGDHSPPPYAALATELTLAAAALDA
jgi:hypothetical protein